MGKSWLRDAIVWMLSWIFSICCR